MAGASDVCDGGSVRVQEGAGEFEELGMFAVCELCGYDRRVADFNECLVCKWKREGEELKSQNLVLTLQLEDMKEEVRSLKEAVEGIRQVISVRPRVWTEEEREAWPVVGESRAVRKDGNQTGKGGSDGSQRGKGESNRCQGRKGDRDRQEWQEARGGKVEVARKDRTEAVVCSNKFSMLEGEVECGAGEEIVVEGRKEKGAEGKGRKGVSGPPQVLVVGDSQVRYLDSTCVRDRSRWKCESLSGAGVKRVSEVAERRVREMEREGVVVLHVGGNDVRAGGSEELVARYREMLGKIRESGRRCVVSGVLPRFWAGRAGISVGEWLSRAIGVNERLKVLCREAGVSFVEEWDRFYGRRELYVRDGVHLSGKGVEVLRECLERAVRIECRG